MVETSEGATLKPSQDASRILSISIGLDFVAFLLAAGRGGRFNEDIGQDA